tara:strand:- start:4362 stop:4601 length:240 start_codon:yes stop_codon:yes gene_type:complete
MARLTVAILVTQDLGYCCPYFFFTHFRNTGLLAARLGVTDRAIRLAKARVDDGEWTCPGSASCLRRKITTQGTARKVVG